jgi:hypothetical protein
MQRIDLNDFAGGINEQFAADNFSTRQWSRLKGFVMDTDLTIRTQWAAQSVGASNAITGGVKAVSGFTGSSNSYLVAISNTGYVWWAIAPSDTANYTVANAVSWTLLNTISPNTDYRFIAEVLLPVATLGEVNALLIHSVSGSTDAVAIYENDLTSSIATKTWNRFYPVDQPNLIKPLPGETLNTTTARTYTATTTWSTVTTFTGGVTSTVAGTPWTLANDGAYPVDVRIGTGATITTIQPLDSYTHTAALTLGQSLQVQATGGSSLIRVGILLGSYPLARRNIMPRANVGTMWRNRLILGDINTRRDVNLAWTATNNIQRSPYAFFYSEISPDSFHEQSVLFAGSGESQILGLHVLDDYLITIASPATESDGLRVYKGTLDYISLQQGNVTINVNVLRGGIGPSRDLTTSGNRISSCIWAEAGVVVFLDHLGGVWYTDGVQVDRLDRVGPVNPDRTVNTDEVAALGKYLFMKRDGRYLLLNMMDGERGQSGAAAWTELTFPAFSVAPKSFAPVGGSMYYVMDDKVYRFCVSRNNTSDSERASFDNVQVDCTVGTPTIGDTNQHRKSNWFRFGMRARSRFNSANTQVRTVIIKAGPNLDSSTFNYSTTLNRQLVDRDEFVLPAGIGSSVEASAETTFRGDLQIESATFWTVGGKFSRPQDGSDA